MDPIRTTIDQLPDTLFGILDRERITADNTTLYIWHQLTQYAINPPGEPPGTVLITHITVTTQPALPLP